ncbi:S-adenosyl-L-methionine-dependent methyltransferase [Lentinula novae-zelandiae]|nr:S-adenosyl-L-methionine-dependent methyltransferase [Lentinula novae-zelandiae]
MVLHEEFPQLSSTPPALYTPSLSSTFAESSTAGYSNASTPTATSASASSSTTLNPVTGSSENSSVVLDDYEYTHGDKYEAKENWITRKHRLKLHPYGADAPYMQSYDSVSLSADRYTHLLLRRLNPNGTPSFYDYVKNKKPIPSSILDLGCGEGHWIIDAHASWPEARIVGFDLVDVILPEVRNNERLHFVRGNFIRYPLPFPHSSFDLIRIANLSLAIPTERWNFVLSEIHRVLQVGGRLELIDDAFCFPYGKETVTPSPRARTFATAPNRRRPLVLNSAELSNSLPESLEEEQNVVSSPETTPNIPANRPSHEDTSEWANSANDGKALEAIFYNMLETKYGIHTRTPKGVTTFMKDIFGPDNVRKLRSMHLKLAPLELEELIPHTKRPKFRVRSLSKGTELDTRLESEGKFAAGRLGIPYSALAVTPKTAQTTSPSVPSVHSNHSASSVASMSCVSDETPRSSSDTRTSFDAPEEPVPVQQSPGLLLLPSTFIPMPPAELEMHACKHMHTLLSCKRAIFDWLLYNDDGTDNDCVSEDSLRDAFFEYDSFRRLRLNWPSQTPEINTNDYDYNKNIEISFEGPKSSGSRSSTVSVDSRLSSTSEASIGPYNRHALTHVRTFRVYLAVKTRRLSSRAST